MDATHLHLILSHFPIIGTFIGLIILLVGLINNQLAYQKVALVIFIIMAILTIPVFLTGEEAEETVEIFFGISESLIENHEELAEKAIWLMGLLGVLSFFNLFVIHRKKSYAKSFSWVLFIISVITFSIFAQLGNLG